jgi:hypothetical protein
LTPDQKHFPTCLSVHAEPGPKAKGFNPDFLGVGGSFLCILHCLMPQFAAMGFAGLGFGAMMAGDAWTLVFWISCLIAVWQAGKKTVYLFIRLLLWLSFFVFSLTLCAELFFHSGHLVSMAGSLVLIATHLFNLKKQNEWKKSLRRTAVS